MGIWLRQVPEFPPLHMLVASVSLILFPLASQPWLKVPPLPDHAQWGLQQSQ